MEILFYHYNPNQTQLVDLSLKLQTDVVAWNDVTYLTHLMLIYDQIIIIKLKISQEVILAEVCVEVRIF